MSLRTRLAATLRRSARQILEAPVGWPGVLVCLTSVVVVRTVLELLLSTQHTVLYYGGTYLDLLAYANAYVSWLATSLLLGLIVKRFLRLDLLRTARLVCTLLAVSWIVPPINWLATQGKGAELFYGNGADDLLFNLIHLFDPTATIAMAPAGVRVEIFVVTIGCVLLAPIAFRISLVRGFALALSIYAAIFALGYLPPAYGLLMTLLPPGRRWAIETPTDFFLIYVPLLVALGAWLVRDALAERRLPPGAISWLLYPSRLGFYLCLALFGFLHGAAHQGLLRDVLAPRPVLQFVSMVLSISLLFAWARISNDFHDQEIDVISNQRRPIAAGLLDPAVALHNGRVLLALSFLTIIPAGPTALPLWGLAAALSQVYSSPPLRLRRYYPLGHILLATVGMSVLALGASLVVGSGLYDYLRENTPLAALFTAFFFLSQLKDLKDVEGDPAAGVNNIFSAVRFRRGLAMLCVVGFTAATLFVLRGVGLWQALPIALVAVFLVTSLGWLGRLQDLRRAERIFGLVFVLACALGVLWLQRNLG